MRIAAVVLVVAASLLTPGDARAKGRNCEVVFVRAPSEVRLVIESWLEAEPRCSGTIELRVIETESGGLYLIAQRPDGRIHEREVPDAQSAGVLVASWVADDWTSAQPDETHAPPIVEPVAAPPFVSAPGVTEVTQPSPRPASRATRWLSVAGMIQTEGQGGTGARFEIDLLGSRSGKWTLGIAGVGVSSRTSVFTTDGNGWLETIDLRAVLVGARTWRLGENWNVRWSVGFGPAWTSGLVELDTYGQQMRFINADGVSLAYESSITLARELFDHRWAITAGPATTLISQTLDAASDSDPEVVRNKLELMFMLGARYRL